MCRCDRSGAHHGHRTGAVRSAQTTRVIDGGAAMRESLAGAAPAVVTRGGWPAADGGIAADAPTPIHILLAALITGFHPAVAGRGKGGPQAHPAGTRSALPATRCSRPPRPAVERLP